MFAFIRYIEVYFTFAFLNCVRYNEDFAKSRFVKSRFCSIHFIVILAWLKKIFCYAEDFVIQNRLVRRPATQVTVLRAARYRSISRSLFHILPGEVHPKKHLNIVGSQKNVFLKFPTTWISLIGWCFGLNQVQPYCTCIMTEENDFSPTYLQSDTRLRKCVNITLL